MANKNIYIDDFDNITKKYLNEISTSVPLTKDEEVGLWEKYKKTGDISARNKIVSSNLKFVAKIAGLYRGRGLSYSDLIAEGNLGFMKALDYFDGKRGNKILSYSVWWIRQTIDEAIEKRNLFVGDYVPDELDYLKDDSSSKDNIVVDNAFENEESIREKRRILKDGMSILSKKEQKMLSMYYGLDNNLPRTLEEVGNEFNLTRERVRQINNKSLMKLRSSMLEKKLC